MIVPEGSGFKTLMNTFNFSRPNIAAQALGLAQAAGVCFSDMFGISGSPEVSPASERVVYLTDEQWRKIKRHISKKSGGKKGGRPRADDRWVFEGIL